MAKIEVNSDIASTEIYRFTSLRAVNSLEKDALNRRFVKFELSQVQQKMLDADASLLLNKIPLLRKQADSRKNILAAVEDFFTNSKLKIASVNELFSTDNASLNYPDFHDVYLWLRENNSNKEIKDTKGLIKQLETVLNQSNILGKTITNFVDNTNPVPDGYYYRKIALWENLIAYYYTPTDYLLIEEISKLIRWFWIMEKLNANDANLAVGQDIYEASKATILLPSGFSTLEAPPPVKEVAKPPIEQPKENPGEDYGQKLVYLNNAFKEIADAYKNQNISRAYSDCSYTGKRQGDMPSPELLNGRAVGNLSESTHKILNVLNVPKDILHIPSTLSAINEEKKLVYNKIMAGVPRNQMVQIGNSIVNSGAYFTPPTKYLGSPLPLPIDPLKIGKPTPTTVGKNIRMGMADLKIIQTQLLKYGLGEVAHIENVLLGETKNRTFRELNRTEQVLFTDVETTTETLKDSQTTDRFELSQEISKIQKDDLKFSAGLNVTADLGTVKINATADFSYASSKEESNKTDTRSSKEIVNRALNSIKERKRTQTTITTLRETEDTSVHGFNNYPGTDNIAGVYNWVDKYYIAQVKNYGAHIMLDFMIPEPAAFYLYSKIHKKSELLVKEKPQYPKIYDEDGFLREIKSFKEVTDINYQHLATQYNAIVSIYPEEIKYFHNSITSPTPNEKEYPTFVLKDESLIIDTGYEAKNADYVFIFDNWKNRGNFFNGLISKYFFGSPEMIIKGDGSGKIVMDNETGKIPISIHTHTREFIVNIKVTAEITQKKIDEWKLQTFNTIMTAYQNKLTEYEDWLKEKEINTGVYISGNNPDRNREIEKEELKKGCIELLTAQRFESFDAMREDTGTAYNKYPEFSFPDADDEGKYIQFFEQLFLWDQMTYIFFPYFWGRREKWVDLKSLEDTDPLFTKFLQAGAARVLVPLRLGDQYLSALKYFLSGENKGTPWNGGEAPLPNDKDSLWISVTDELKESLGQFETKGTMDGKPWIVKMPTNLVYLHSINKDTMPTLPDNTSKLQDLLGLVEDKSILV